MKDPVSEFTIVLDDSEEQVRFRRVNKIGFSAWYYMDDGGKYFLKWPTSLKEAKNEVDVLRRLHAFTDPDTSKEDKHHFPRVLHFSEDGKIVFRNRGKPVNYETIPGNALEQAESILAFLRRARICKRDLTRHEILVDDDGKLVITDFGMSIGEPKSDAEFEKYHGRDRKKMIRALKAVVADKYSREQSLDYAKEVREMRLGKASDPDSDDDADNEK